MTERGRIEKGTTEREDMKGEHREGEADEGAGLIQPDLFNPSSHVGVHECTCSGMCTRG